METANTAPSQHHPVVDDCRDQRESTIPEYTVAQAIDDAKWVERTPDALITEPGKAKRIITTLLAGIRSNPRILKALEQNIPCFPLLAYDKAGHSALKVWIVTAEHHGCNPEQLEDARRKLTTWQNRDDVRWPK